MAKKVTHIAEVLYALKQHGLYPLLRRVAETSEIIMADDLTSKNAITNIRAEQAKLKIPIKTMPLFAWSRSALRTGSVMEDRGRFKTNTTLAGSTENTNKVLDTIHAEFDVRFMYICNNMQELEQFEIEYLTRSGISNIKGLNVVYEDLSNMPYEFFWKDLENKVIQENGMDIKVIEGSFLIRGFFFVFENEMKRINSINFNLYKKDDELSKSIIFHQEVIE